MLTERLASLGARVSIVAIGAAFVFAAGGLRADEGKPAAHPAGPSKTIGLVLSKADYLLYQTPGGKQECPDGPVFTNRQNWEAQFPTNEARAKHLERCGSPQNRGPNCENVWFSPEVMEDPLPFHEVRSKVSYGFNLDGTLDGHETATTCAHEKFVSPDGQPGVDNQWYRFWGCHAAVMTDRPNKTRQDMLTARYRWLVEVTGVDNEQNDDHVDVAIYRGWDPLVIDSDNQAVPWQSQEVAELEFRLKGHIVDGVLETEPADVEWHEGIQWESHETIRGMKLRLRLTPDGAEGYRIGYMDVDQMWQIYARTMSGVGNVIGAGAPAAYRAMHRLADGYKDPKTGTCTALSSARKFGFVRAFIVHPERERISALNK